MAHALEFTCNNCGNTTTLPKIDEEGDIVLECLACEEVEPMAEHYK